MIDANCYIGLMSGTSVDAVDAVIVHFEAPEDRPTILATHSEPPPDGLRATLLAAAAPDYRLDLREYGHLDQAVGAWFAQAANQAMRRTDINPSYIAAIGSHGQTIGHAPNADYPFSVQIGAAPRMAALTGCPVVSDFRNADMALGGQGAPLVGAFHAAMFATSGTPRVVVNIGGIANLTLLPSEAGTTLDAIRGFDTGPGNGVMDAWAHHCLGQSCDDNGDWAASGQVDDSLLECLLADAYFQQPPPKSTGRDHFGLAWLMDRLARLNHRPAAEDVQATLCELTAISIIKAIDQTGTGKEAEIYLCGGGIHNRFLVQRIRALAGKRLVAGTKALGVDPDWVEALAFAWLARQRMLGLPGNATGVTGAQGSAILGGLHLPPSGPARA